MHDCGPGGGCIVAVHTAAEIAGSEVADGPSSFGSSSHTTGQTDAGGTPQTNQASGEYSACQSRAMLRSKSSPMQLVPHSCYLPSSHKDIAALQQTASLARFGPNESS